LAVESSDAVATANALDRRQGRAVASLIFRIVALPVLVTLLCRSAPALSALRPLLEAASVAAALFPFFATWGRLTAARIALGRARAEKADWPGAERLLTPIGRRLGARLFDATGEGRYHLALALGGLGREGSAHRLYEQLAAEIGERSEWGRRSAAAVAACHSAT